MFLEQCDSERHTDALTEHVSAGHLEPIAAQSRCDLMHV